MIYPIVKFGNPILEKPAEKVTVFDEELKKLIEDMWETMYESSGVGLAAPQINKSIRLFVIDSTQIFTNLEDDEQGKLHAFRLVLLRCFSLL